MCRSPLSAVTLDALIQSIHSVLLVFDARGRLVLWNPSAERSLRVREGSVPEEVLDRVGPEVRQAVASCLRTGRTVRCDEVVLDLDGDTRRFGFTASPVRQNGGIVGAVVTGRDITERVEVDRTVGELNRRADRERIIRQVVHELRKPLNAIRGHAQYLLLTCAPGDPAREYARVIVDEVDRMDHLLEGLRGLEDGGEMALRVESPSPALRRAAELMRPVVLEKAGVFEVDVPSGLPAVAHDPERLEQVVLNLLQNAVDAVPAGGRIALRAAPVGSGVRVEVWDNGPGVPPDLGERVFDLFVTTKGPAGKGIGLALCRDIVERHGGTISFESEPGRGTAFIVTLPAPP